jgi:hypothetical protein
VDISWILGVAAALVHSVAYIDYNRDVFKGTRRPNGPTWAIWALLAILSATSYLSMVGDWAKAALSLTNILLCILTFVVALVLKRFDRLTAGDYVALAIGCASALVWWWYKSAMYANLLLQTGIVAGFVPTIRLIWHKPRSEQPRPWLI